MIAFPRNSSNVIEFAQIQVINRQIISETVRFSVDVVKIFTRFECLKLVNRVTWWSELHSESVLTFVSKKKKKKSATLAIIDASSSVLLRMFTLFVRLLWLVNTGHSSFSWYILLFLIYTSIVSPQYFETVHI